MLRALVFLAIFVVVLWAVTVLYLPAAASAVRDADPQQRRQLSASALLILAVVLFVLFAGLLLTFRIGRYFFPRPSADRPKPTVYTDAWAEAGRRVRVSEDAEEE